MSSKRGSLIRIPDDSDSSSDVSDNRRNRELSQESVLSSLSSQLDNSPVLLDRTNSPSDDETSESSIPQNNVQQRKTFKKRVPKSSRKRSGNQRQEKFVLSQSLDELSIYSAIKDDFSTMMIVNRWIKEYEKSQPNGNSMLMQFFIDSAGFKKTLTTEMCTNLSESAIVNRIAQDLKNSDEKYPLIKTGAEWKLFREMLCQFLTVLIEKCEENGILYDSNLIDKIVPFLTELSKHGIRALRHTSTLIGITIITTLVNIFAKMNEESENEDRSSQELSLAENTQEKKKMIRSVMCVMVERILFERVKDVSAEIRLICIQGIGLWIKNCPKLFLTEKFLKFIGIMLHDSDAGVRLESVKALQPLYASEILQVKLIKFTEEFKQRLLNMTHDIKDAVAIEALKTVIKIWRYQSEILKNNCELVFELVFEPNPKIAQLAVKFSKMCFLHESVPETESMSDNVCSTNTNFIKNLLLFYVEANVSGLSDLFVDSFFDESEAMKDWQSMTDLLLEDDVNQNDMDHRNQSALIKIMNCCIKRTATGEIPELRGGTKKISSKQKQEMKKDTKQLTKHFLQTLPLLISKYREDAQNLELLLQIPKYFDLKLQFDERDNDNLDSLLIEIQTVIKTVQESKPLENAVKALCYFCNDGHENHTKCNKLCSKLIDLIVKTYKTNFDELMIAIDNKLECAECLDNFSQSLKQVSFFYMHYDLNPWNIWDSLVKQIEDDLSISNDTQRCISDEGIKNCIASCYSSLLWKYREILGWEESESAETSNSITEEHCSRLRENLYKFMKLMITLITQEDVQKPVSFIVKDTAYTAFCDLLLFFSDRLKLHSDALLHQLAYESNGTTLKMINDFLDKFVFNLDENLDEGVEYLNKRRQLLASFCKLIINNVVPVKDAAYLFKYYAKFDNNYGDIFKKTFLDAMLISSLNCALTMQCSLNILFEELLIKKGRIDRNDKEFVEIKELAKKFAVCFEDDVKNKEAIIALVKTGISFSFKADRDDDMFDLVPKNLLFLEIISEFNDKLLKEDKTKLLEFLETKTQLDIKSLQGKEWQPLVSFRTYLENSKDEFKKPRKPKKTAKPRMPELQISRISTSRIIPSSYSQPLSSEGNIDLREYSPDPSIEDSSQSTVSPPNDELEEPGSSFQMDVSPIDETN